MGVWNVSRTGQSQTSTGLLITNIKRHELQNKFGEGEHLDRHRSLYTGSLMPPLQCHNDGLAWYMSILDFDRGVADQSMGHWQFQPILTGTHTDAMSSSRHVSPRPPNGEMDDSERRRPSAAYPT